MSVKGTIGMKFTSVETLATNTDSAADAKRQVTHDRFDHTLSDLGAATTPPVTMCAYFVKALANGSATIDLTALTGTNGATVNGTGLKVQGLRIKNLGANPLTVVPGASNGYGFAGADAKIVLAQNQEIGLSLVDASPDIAAGAKTLDLSGTAAQTSEWTIMLG